MLVGFPMICLGQPLRLLLDPLFHTIKFRFLETLAYMRCYLTQTLFAGVRKSYTSRDMLVYGLAPWHIAR